MTAQNKILLVAALLPAIALLLYVYKKDKTDKEPVSLLLLLLGLGAVSCFPAAILENVIGSVIDANFGISDTAALSDEFLSSFRYTEYLFVTNFFGIALIEEGCKLLILYFVTRKNKNFDCLFDGLIYSVFVSLGFAALENIMYVFESGLGTAFVRAIMSVPGHMFFAVFMGYNYTMWRMNNAARDMEKVLKLQGRIPKDAKEFSGASSMASALAIPVFFHGLYDFCCSSDSTLFLVILFALLIFMYVYCFKKIKELSRKDTYSYVFASAMLCKKYPYLMNNR